MERSRIPVRIQKMNDRTDRRLPPSSPSSSLSGFSTAEKPTEERLLFELPRLSPAKQPTDERQLLPTSFSFSLPRLNSAEQTIGKRQSPSLVSPALSGPTRFTEQPTGTQPRKERNWTAHKDGRHTGHYVDNNVAKDHSRVHYGDNYNETHHYNYQGPSPDEGMPRNLEEGITNNKVSKYITHVMDELSFGSMGMRKGTIAPALINTCQWLLSSLEYINWRNPDRIHHNHGLMWIKGKAGAGKSTLMKFLIESTRSRHSGDNIISFFFNARGDDMEKSLSGLYRHLLHQLMSSVLRLQHTMVDDINTLASQGWQLQPLKGLFRAAVLGLRSERFTCFIDALDESSEDEIQDLIDFFEELSNDVVARGISFHVCFSSRHYPNVELETCQHLNLDRKAEHENDISLYIKSKLKLPIDGTSNDLIPLMQKKAQGVFLWAVLVTQILNKDYRHGENHKARSRLEKIPPDLHSLFHEMIHRNVEDPNDTRGLASILQWIAFALRPLAPQELYYAVSSEDPDFDFSQLWQTNLVDLETMKLFILNRSKGLVELTTIHRRTIVQFIHESVRDFLNETGFDILMPGRGVPLLGYAHNNLTQCCFRWMHVTSSLREQISRVLSEKHRTRKLVIEQIPLLSYIVEFMIKHADLACTNGVSQENFIETFPTGMWISFAQSVSDGYISRVLSHGGRSELDPQRSMPPLLREVLMYYRAHALFEIERQRKRTLQKPFTQRDFSTIRFSPKKSLLPEESNDDFEFLLHIGSPSHTAMERQITTLMAVVDRRKARILQLMQTPRVATSSSCPPKAD